MNETDAMKLCNLSKVLPNIPYARHSAGFGVGRSASSSAPFTSRSQANIKVVGLYCSRAPTEEKVVAQVKEEDGRGTGSSSRRNIYVRVQIDKMTIEMLPLDVMRRKYPQVLIDYLLATAAWV
ncbi:hypothetical protein, conserved [Trypanosoma brucei gambiense DAL972]|uniref:Uncharacterized protein n=2 Tax=Trypanosoma brucei TaxID=5691 RepID=D0A960_TRYB9|nr:hypothetical protein, conserved [Trypanosoma brucei gambiense DAL972]RHW68067.1 hypothetical protein DPX39_110095800 [Trypanosoma brucei equiperdum]CBH18211.1 hypothetical protein, conserved [Trypanosoma brucei gambiense DAL972]|eukprot:XP_011780475.1 hypothetical protein, conserved [Trypanosoma brucei gambiense DAL972]